MGRSNSWPANPRPTALGSVKMLMKSLEREPHGKHHDRQGNGVQEVRAEAFDIHITLSTVTAIAGMLPVNDHGTINGYINLRKQGDTILNFLRNKELCPAVYEKRSVRR